MKVCTFFLLAFISLSLLAKPGGINLYVDPVKGSDSNLGSKGKPFRTIERARDEIRQNHSSMSGNITVYLRGGEYNYADRYTVRQVDSGEKAYTVRTSELTFDERDSGEDGYMIVYKAYPGETPVISGGKRIAGWRLHNARLNIYKANIGKGIDTRQLYVNGKRAIVARSEGMPANLTFENAYGHTTTDTFMANWKHVQDLEFVYYDQWVEFRIKVDDIIANNGVATIKMYPSAWQFSTTGRYTKIRSKESTEYFENAYELLDSDGEWYLDRSAGDLFYKPRSGEDMKMAEVVVPVVDELLTAKGSSRENRFENVGFEGITFEYAGWLRPNIVKSNIFCATLRDVNRYPESAVIVSSANGITFERNKFLRLGSVGLKMDNGIKDVTIAGNKFVDISGGAMTIEEPHFKPLDMTNVVIKNNYIRKVGLEYTAVPGIYVAQGKNIYIGHNEICELPYNGMCISMHGNSISEHVVIENNYVHDMGTMTKVFDVGAIYASGTNILANEDNPAFTVRGNYIRNETNGIGAIYADNGSTWWYAYNNVIDLRYSPPWKEGKEPVAMHTNWGEHLRFVNNYTTTDKTDFWMPADIADKWKPETNSYQWNLYPDAIWPREAIGIIANAGLEEPYRDLWDTEDHFNMVLNPGFETRQEAQVWIGESAQWNRTVDERHLGITSAKVTPTKASGYIYQAIAANKGLHYQVSTWVKSVSAGKFNATLHAAIGEGSSAQMLTLDKAAITSGDWVLLEGEFDYAGNEISTPVKIFVQTDSPAGTPYYLDDFQVIENREISKEMLREAITSAKRLYDSSVEGLGAGEYAQGSMTGFFAGIEDAQKALTAKAGKSQFYFALKALYAHQSWFQEQRNN
jgi:hypothetical protein